METRLKQRVGSAIFLAMLLFVAATAILLPGCGSKGEGAHATDAIGSMDAMPGHNMTAEASSQPAPSGANKTYKLTATAKKVGDAYIVEVDTDLAFSQEHYNGKHEYGEGHIHFYVNGSLKGPIMQNGPYTINADWLSDGDNALKLTLAGNDHSEPYGATAELTLKKE